MSQAWTYPFTPTERQRALAASAAQEALFGGGNGGGKTEALLAAGVDQCVTVPGSVVYIFRRTYSMLEREIVPRLASRLPVSVATYNGSKHCFTFGNGSTLWCAFMESDDDKRKYVGVEMTLALFDELCDFTREQYTFIRSRLRMAGPLKEAMDARGLKPRMISSASPIGRGVGWVKRAFVDPYPLGDKVFLGGIEEGQDPEGARSMEFIPSLATDNPYLDQAAYARQLSGLDPMLRRALQFGDWSCLEGSRFGQFATNVHVIPSSAIPFDWPRCVGVDWGVSNPFAALWLAQGPDNTLVAYRELYQRNLTAEQQARLILAAEDVNERGPGRPLPVILDPSTWARGPTSTFKPLNPDEPAHGSVAAIYRRVFAGQGQVLKANNDRISGWHLLDEHLRLREDGLPRLLVMDNCRNLVRTFPEQQRSQSNPEDMSSTGDDHLMDATRYAATYLDAAGLTPRVAPEPLDAPAWVAGRPPDHVHDLGLVTPSVPSSVRFWGSRSVGDDAGRVVHSSDVPGSTGPPGWTDN